jgi:hypothetical protein
MGPMICVMMFQEILMAHQCQAIGQIEIGLVKIWFSDFKTEPKLILLTAMTPFLLLLDSFISHLWTNDIGAVMSQGILMAHQCQAIGQFELGGVKIWFSDFIPEPKLTLLTAMTPYLLLPDSFISHLWDQ